MHVSRILVEVVVYKWLFILSQFQIIYNIAALIGTHLIHAKYILLSLFCVKTRYHSTLYRYSVTAACIPFCMHAPML